LSSNDPLSPRDRWARLRFSIVGALLASPPKGGELRAQLKELASKTYRHPLTAEAVRFGYSSLERWFYIARKSDDPVKALRERPRSHAGRLRSVSATAIQILTAQYREHPNWSALLHADNLRAALSQLEPDRPAPSYPSVRRYLKAQGLFRRPRPKRNTEGAITAAERLEKWEVRSYEAEYVHALWHADFHDGSRKVLTKGANWITPILFGAIDDRSRMVCHLQWYTNEQTETLVHGVSQALQRRGRPLELRDPAHLPIRSDSLAAVTFQATAALPTTVPRTGSTRAAGGRLSLNKAGLSTFANGSGHRAGDRVADPCRGRRPAAICTSPAVSEVLRA